MSPLGTILAQRIRRDGPLRVADYMALALGHPAHGYYATRDPFGRAGDFVTAPEISQMYGELIGLWCAVVWQQMGEPDPVNLVELGPGRGTLMADALRAARGVDEFPGAIRLHLVETSPRLREIQAATLASSGIVPHWHDGLETVPEGPALAVASEFFDALPVRQLVRTDGGWAERLVGGGDDRFRFVIGAADEALSRLVPEPLREAPAGAVWEFSPAAVAVMADLAGSLTRHGGAALIVDYGHAVPGLGETLQAVKDHDYADLLIAPGEADITAHVDFTVLAEAAAAGGASAYGPVEQGAFLGALGIESRADSLRADADEDQRAAIDAALHRLTGSDAMGRLFKVLAVAAPTQPIPPGFA